MERSSPFRLLSPILVNGLVVSQVVIGRSAPMAKKKLSVNQLATRDFEEIMVAAKRKTSVPLVKSEQINMRLSADLVKIAKELAKRAGKPTTTFLSDLLKVDLFRIWNLTR